MKIIVIEKSKNEKHYFDNEENAFVFLKERNISRTDTKEIFAEDEIINGNIYKLIII